MRTLILAAMFALAVPAAQAQTQGSTSQSTTTDSLTGICSALLQQQAGGVSGDHDKLCACLVRETPAQLSLADMSAYEEATLANRAPPDAVMQKITAIATKCLTQAQ